MQFFAALPLLARRPAAAVRTTTYARQLSMSAAPVGAKLKLAAIQVVVSPEKQVNIERVSRLISDACKSPTDVAILPEIWNSPYATTSFPVNAEVLPDIGKQPDISLSPSATMLCNKAREHGVWLIGGSIPERSIDSQGKEHIYNTCLVINPMGDVVGKHRKIHLFDIDVPGRMTFKESDSLSAGQEPCIVDTPWGKLGVGICYDIRFPELAMLMRQRGCKILAYPGAFNMVTGPAHWELLQRARAVDNQLYVVTCSPARVEGAGYVAWGHSSVVNPWGEVIAKAGAGEEIIRAELEMSKVEEMRQNIPCWSQKRNDLYSLVDVKKQK
jgi:omega-amidase